MNKIKVKFKVVDLAKMKKYSELNIKSNGKIVSFVMTQIHILKKKSL